MFACPQNFSPKIFVKTRHSAQSCNLSSLEAETGRQKI